MDLSAPSRFGGIIIEVPKHAAIKDVSPIARNFIRQHGPVTLTEALHIYRGLMASDGIWFRCYFEQH